MAECRKFKLAQAMRYDSVYLGHGPWAISCIRVRSVQPFIFDSEMLETLQVKLEQIAIKYIYSPQLF